MQDFLHTPPGSAPVAIIEDGGGYVTEYQRKAQQYTFEGRRVEIRGSCRSACVLALSVPDVCVTPGAIVKAHHAYEIHSKQVRADITHQMMSELPVKIRAALEPQIQTRYTQSSTLTYNELRALGVPDCAQVKTKPVKAQTQQETALRQIMKYFGK